MELTNEERRILNGMFENKEIKAKRISVDKYDTDLAVKFHDAAGRALGKNKIRVAISKYTDCILVGYSCLTRNKPFYPGVVASACYWMAMCKAKLEDFTVALALAKQARIFYIDLNKTSDGFKDKIDDCERLINSLKEVMAENERS